MKELKRRGKITQTSYVPTSAVKSRQDAKEEGGRKERVDFYLSRQQHPESCGDREDVEEDFEDTLGNDLDQVTAEQDAGKDAW